MRETAQAILAAFPFSAKLAARLERCWSFTPHLQQLKQPYICVAAGWQNNVSFKSNMIQHDPTSRASLSFLRLHLVPYESLKSSCQNSNCYTIAQNSTVLRWHVLQSNWTPLNWLRNLNCLHLERAFDTIDHVYSQSCIWFYSWRSFMHPCMHIRIVSTLWNYNCTTVSMSHVMLYYTVLSLKPCVYIYNTL